MRQNSIFSRGVGVLAIRISGAALQLALVAMAVALFPITDVGHNAILWSTAVIARVGGTFGIDLYLLRELPSLWNRSQSEFALRCKGLMASLLKVLIPILIVAIVGIIWLFHLDKIDRDLAFALPIVALSSSLQRLWSCQLRARGQLMVGQLFDAVALPLVAIIFLTISSIWAPHLFIAGQCAAIILVSLVMFGLLRRDWKQPGRPQLLSIRDWKDIVPLGVGSALSVLASRGPILFVGASSVAQAASYEIGQRIHSAATLASASATAVLFPRVKGLINTGQTKQLWRELASSAVLGLVPALLILAGLLLVGGNRTEALMGPEYGGAWLTAVILSGAACINAVTGLCHGVLAMAGSSRAFWVIAAIQAAATFIYGVLFFDGTASHMALFVLGAELCRGALLTILTRRLITRVAKWTPESIEEVL